MSRKPSPSTTASPRLTDKFGSSATPVTSTLMVPDVVAKSPSSVVDVAVTVRSKSTLLSSGAVIVRPAASVGNKDQTPPPRDVPADNVAPAGTPEMVSESVSDGSVKDASIFSAIAASSNPCVSPTFRVGASAGSTPLSTVISM